MHIPDGYLSPQTYLPLYGASFFLWTIALKKMKKELSVKHVPYLAMAAAFSFVIQMFNIPIPGGTTGHAVGAGIIAILLGPWTAVIAVSVVLMIQAIVFGDGGITAIGANCFNMAVVMPFVSYWVFKLLKGSATAGFRLHAASFLSGYIGLSVSAIVTAIEFGIQPLIAMSPDGRPLYAPYPLEIAVPAMVLEHLLLFGVVEGIVTVLLIKYFLKHEPGLIYSFQKGGFHKGDEVPLMDEGGAK
jgi:cobalt/nickel transport system permease protein